MPKATITVEVETFRAVGTGLCVIKPLVVTDSAGGRVAVDPAHPLNLKVSGRGSIDMEFVIQPAAEFLASGVAFDREGLDERGGRNNFSLGRIEDNVLTVVNHTKKVGGGQWELYIAIVKRGHTRELGIIDPGIENAE